LGPSGPKTVSKESCKELPTEQFIEVTSSATPMTREEFRALCDEKKTAEAIKTALELH
jgi:hypothetical protein